MLRGSLTHKLESLYACWGYGQYTMGKFEEYDLYARYKDFLLSDRVLTFTDPSGKLLALKPDVTLSIAKNTRDTESVRKLYYLENVYRVVGDGFRELPQLGLEALGPLDDYSLLEVTQLAARSLEALGRPWVLSISHLGILGGVLEELGVAAVDRKRILSLVGSKNRHELAQLCRELGLDGERLLALAELSGPGEQVLPRLEALAPGAQTDLLRTLWRGLAPWKTSLQLDLSAVEDTGYYTGLVLKGYVEGVPECVLSGGQYGGLMRRLRRQNDAMGFAVYLDLLAALEPPAQEALAVLTYGPGEDPAAVLARVEQLQAKGLRVSAQPERRQENA